MSDLTNSGLFGRARAVIPGGVDSPVRAFGSVGGEPYFVARAEGVHVWDVEGRRYTDFVQSYGAVILGHSHPVVVEAVQRAAERGTSYGAPTEGEVLLAEAIVERVPSVDRVRLVNSGTEATMTASAGRPGLHRPGPGRQVRGQLPRPRRRPAGRLRQRGGHPRPARLGRACPPRPSPRPWSPPTTWCPRSVTTWPASSSSRSPPTWAWSHRSPASSRDCGPPATRPAPCWSSTR